MFQINFPVVAHDGNFIQHQDRLLEHTRKSSWSHFTAVRHGPVVVVDDAAFLHVAGETAVARREQLLAARRRARHVLGNMAVELAKLRFRGL
jgi:hypothetical protein